MWFEDKYYAEKDNVEKILHRGSVFDVLYKNGMTRRGFMSEQLSILKFKTIESSIIYPMDLRNNAINWNVIDAIQGNSYPERYLKIP